MLFASLLTPVFAGWFYLYPAHEFHQYLTNWGLVAVFSSLCISAYMPYSKTYRKKPKLMALNHALMSLAIIMQLVITVVYWTMLHKEVIKKNSHNMTAVVYQYAAHSLPAIACTYNLSVTDFLFYRGYTTFVLSIGVLFLGINFVSYLVTGHVTYWFLNWSDPMLSIIASTSLLTLGVGFV